MSFTKVKDFLILTVVMWPHIVEKWLYLASDSLEKNIAKNVPKTAIC
jgi:hypothetical protein